MDLQPAQGEKKSYITLVVLLLVSLGLGFLFGNMLNGESLLKGSGTSTSSDSPLITEKIATVPQATITNINAQQVVVQDNNGKLTTFLINGNAVFIDRTKNPTVANVSSDLSAIKPGQKLQLILEASDVNPQLRVTQFILSKTPQKLSQLLPTRYNDPVPNVYAYKELAKLAGFSINNISINAKITKVENNQVTVETATGIPFTFPAAKNLVVRRFDVATKTETKSNDMQSVPVSTGKQTTAITLSSLTNGGTLGTYEIVDVFYSVGSTLQK